LIALFFISTAILKNRNCVGDLSNDFQFKKRRIIIFREENMAKISTSTEQFEYLNEVSLIGRLSGVPVEKDLPSGDKVVELRVIIGRPKNSKIKSKVSVDTIDIAIWGAKNRKTALKFDEHSWIEVKGAIRRRFWHSPSGLASRWQVEASEIYAI
jgi:hypothetical protein